MIPSLSLGLLTGRLISITTCATGDTVLHLHRVYKGALKDHTITNVQGGKTICLKKSGFPETGKA